jgi:hypothetical protein
MKTRLENDRRYRLKNKDKIKAYQANWAKVNREKIAAQKAKYYAENKEEIAAKGAKYRAENKEKKAATNAKWAKENRATVKASQVKWETEDRKKLSDRYIKKLLIRQTAINKECIPPELVQLKREQIKLNRLITEVTQ